jgi:hypothetical protein
MDHKRYILNKLLDKYEDSSHYYNETGTKRRVLLNFTRKEYPEYDIEDVENKRLIHFVLKVLEDKELIDLEWYPLEIGNIIKRISLNLERIEDAYLEIDRKSKKDLIKNTLIKLTNANANVNSDWIKRFFEDSISEILSKKKLNRYIPKDDDTLNMIIYVLQGIDTKDDDEMLERVFSKRYLGDSKIFERKVKARTVSIIDEYFLNNSGLDEEHTLQKVGIVKSSEELLFYGPLVVDLFGRKIDFTHFCFGSSMNTNMIKSVRIADINVEKVITIENKANYLEYIKKKPMDNLVIYLGGYYSPIKQLLLEKVYSYIKSHKDKTEFYHWGDIDYGGFSIYVQIKNNIIPVLKPLYMDVNTFKKYFKYTNNLEGQDLKNLQRVLNNPDYYVFSDLIKLMLEQDRKLEQEALLFDLTD